MLTRAAAIAALAAILSACQTTVAIIPEPCPRPAEFWEPVPWWKPWLSPVSETATPEYRADFAEARKAAPLSASRLDDLERYCAQVNLAQ